MKRLFILFIICLNYNLLFAEVEITGQVKDAQTKNGLEFCSIAAINQKDSLIKNCVTDNNGYFTLSLHRGIIVSLLVL